MAIEGSITKLRETSHHTECDARSVEQNRGFEAFVDQTTGLQQVHQTNGSFEGNGVECDQSLLTGFSLDVRKNFFLVINEEVSRLIGGTVDCRHVKKR